jgi:AcrR family transcriptional regulator
MAEARVKSSSSFSEPRRLPRGRHALAPEQVLEDQRRRLLAATPGVVAEHGYEAMSVADIVKRAAVSRNAFYKNFSDKQACFAAAHEAGHEWLLQIMTAACEGDGTVRARIERSLGTALDALASDPDLARLLFVEAPSSAGEKIALRYHEWLQHYGTLLRSVTLHDSPDSSPALEIDRVIVGGIATQIASEVLRGDAVKLPDLTARLSDYVLAFYGPARPDPQTAGQVVALEPEPAAKYLEARRRQAGA